jgi:hypothetical protein
MKSILGVLVSFKNNGESQFAGHILQYESYKSLYPVLNCDIYTIANRRFNNKYFSIYCDDEGLLKEDAMFGACSADQKEMLAGNLFIVKHNDEGEIQSLKQEEVDYILGFIRLDKLGNKWLVYDF